MSDPTPVRADQRLAAYFFLAVLSGAWTVLGALIVAEVYAGPADDVDSSGMGLVFVIGVGMLGVASVAAVAGTMAVRRVGSGVWRWRSLVVVTGLAAAASALAALGVGRSVPVLGVLLAFQVVALAAFAAVLRPARA